MADDELDELYRAAPEDFTALRTRLAAAAKKRGDAQAAKQISGARKPTTSAWIVNRLAHSDPDATAQLANLGERLRGAHAAMAGERIRELSAEQRRLVEELTRSAFRSAEVASPSAALRDDVTDTLQAAIADPDVTARLGRLTKAERWSGFGEFGDTTQVFSAGRARKAEKEPAKARPEPDKADARDDKRRAEREQRDQARAVLAAAERAKAEADDALAERQTDLAAARLRRDDARNRLAKAEDALSSAEDAYGEAKQVSREAADTVKEAKARLKQLPATR